ncbi:SPOR domain-containing protein [Ferrimonas marina]|uniref:DamX protein n=1 Tax=Ferrimonas marina TaxID=299255 RepID=A0A1M5XGK8_9GAMM|nr:AAA family ATPase [Ferrimonas marina]SHH98941.1 DamX protein [Ferrimonas marina]
MSSSEAVDTLLPSQRSLLERLRYLTEYGDHLILLHGDAGMGKTTLAQSLLEQCEEFNQAYVASGAGEDPAAIRERLVRQLDAEVVFDPLEPLPDTLERLLPRQPQRMMLVVDDGENLADTLLAELLGLVMDNEALAGRVVLVLCCRPALLQRLLEALPEDAQARLLPVEISPLALRERHKLYQALVAREGQRHFINQEAVDRQLAQSDGSPKAVVALVEALAPSAALSAFNKLTPLHRRGIAVVAGLVVLMMLWLWLDPGPASDVELVEQRIPVALPALEPEPEAQPEPQLALAGEWPPTQVEPTEKAQNEAEAMAQASEASAADEPQELTPAETMVTEADVALVSVDLEDAPAVEEVSSQPVSTPEAEPVDTAAYEPEPEPLPLAEQPLMERPDSSYVLQLAVFSYPNLIPGFLESHGLTEGITVYRIDRQPLPWYVLVMGGYDSRTAAQQAMSDLPDNLAKLSPYIKSMAAVQKELSEQQQLAEILNQDR